MGILGKFSITKFRKFSYILALKDQTYNYKTSKEHTKFIQVGYNIDNKVFINKIKFPSHAMIQDTLFWP